MDSTHNFSDKSFFSSNDKICLFILIVGFSLRVFGLGNESLWYDEGASLNFAALEVKEIFFQQESNPPLYYIFLHFWITFFGDSEFSIRLPSALFGTASIWFFYVVGRQLLNTKAALTGALIIALNTYRIFYSQEARVYELTALLTLLSMYYFINLTLFEKKTSAFGYVIFSTLLLYSHVYGIFIILVQNLYILTIYKFSEKYMTFLKWAGLQICLICLFLPWVQIFLTQTMGIVKQGFWIPEPELISLINSYSILSGSIYLFFFYGIIFILILYFQWPNRNAWNLDRFFASLRQGPDKPREIKDSVKGYYLLILWLITPIWVPFIISHITTPIFVPRYFIVASPALYMLIGGTVFWITNQYLKQVLLAVFVLLSVCALFSYYQNVKKEQWREVAGLVDEEAMEGDLVLFNSGQCIGRVFNFYSSSEKFDKKGFPEKTRDVNDKNIKTLSHVIDGRKRVWLILSHSGKNSDLINKELAKKMIVKKNKEYKGIHLYLYE